MTLELHRRPRPGSPCLHGRVRTQLAQTLPLSLNRCFSSSCPGHHPTERPGPPADPHLHRASLARAAPLCLLILIATSTLSFLGLPLPPSEPAPCSPAWRSVDCPAPPPIQVDRLQRPLPGKRQPRTRASPRLWAAPSQPEPDRMRKAQPLLQRPGEAGRPCPGHGRQEGALSAAGGKQCFRGRI